MRAINPHRATRLGCHKALREPPTTAYRHLHLMCVMSRRRKRIRVISRRRPAAKPQPTKLAWREMGSTLIRPVPPPARGQSHRRHRRRLRTHPHHLVRAVTQRTPHPPIQTSHQRQRRNPNKPGPRHRIPNKVIQPKHVQRRRRRHHTRQNEVDVTPTVIVAALPPHRRPNQHRQSQCRHIGGLRRVRPRPREQQPHVRPRLVQDEQDVQGHRPDRQQPQRAVNPIHRADAERFRQPLHPGRRHQRHNDRRNSQQAGRHGAPTGVNRDH
jgi:hypothetical protein